MFSERSKYIEPATIVTLIIGALCLIGWSFSLFYYKRFNIQSIFFEFTPLFYLKLAFLPIYISGFILAISLLGKFNNTKLSAFRRNLIFFLGGILMIFFGMKKDLSFFIILGFLMSSLTFFLSMRNYSMFDGIYKKKFSNKILFLIVIFIINIIFSGVLGDLIAQNHIESNNIITFDWKGDPPKELEGKDLVLIDIREGNYYVVERQKPANEQPEVYLIPKDQIEFAILKNLK